MASGNTGIVAGITQVVSNVYKHNKQIAQVAGAARGEKFFWDSSVLFPENVGGKLFQKPNKNRIS